MYSYFNCGIGLVLIVNKELAPEVISCINNSGYNSDIIGSVVKGDHEVVIDSMFNDQRVILH